MSQTTSQFREYIDKTLKINHTKNRKILFLYNLVLEQNYSIRRYKSTIEVLQARCDNIQEIDEDKFLVLKKIREKEKESEN